MNRANNRMGMNTLYGNLSTENATLHYSFDDVKIEMLGSKHRAKGDLVQAELKYNGKITVTAGQA